MKKTLLLAAMIAAAAAFAAFDFNGTTAVPVLAPTSISSGATNTATLVKSPWIGRGEIFVSASAANRTALNVTLWATNTVSGGWTEYASGTFTETNAIVARVPFPGEYLPKDVRVTIGSIGASSTCAAFILTY